VRVAPVTGRTRVALSRRLLLLRLQGEGVLLHATAVPRGRRVCAVAVRAGGCRRPPGVCSRRWWGRWGRRRLPLRHRPFIQHRLEIHLVQCLDMEVRKGHAVMDFFFSTAARARDLRYARRTRLPRTLVFIGTRGRRGRRCACGGVVGERSCSQVVPACCGVCGGSTIGAGGGVRVERSRRRGDLAASHVIRSQEEEFR